MGCYNSRSKEIDKLESELKLVSAEKAKVESMIDKKKKTPRESHNLEIRTDSEKINFDKIIDRDQFLTYKIIEQLDQFSSSQTDVIETFTQKILDIRALTGDEKINKYVKLREEESELQSKICEELEEANKKLLQMIYKKSSEMAGRMEILERHLKNDFSFLENLVSLEKQIGSIPKNPHTDFGFLLEKYALLDDIEKNIVTMEKSIPALCENKLILQKFKELEQILSEFTKKSICLAKSIHSKFGEGSLSNQSECIPEKSIEINIETFISIPESLISYVYSLIELEDIKERVINDNTILKELQNLNEELMNYFRLSGNNKQKICQRMHKISKSKSSFTPSIDEDTKVSDNPSNQLLVYIQAIKEKTLKLLKSFRQQDTNILEMTSKLESFEKNINEIEQIVGELLSSDIKDLYKSISYADAASKAELDRLNRFFIDFPADTTKDLFEHIISLQSKLALSSDIEEIRSVIRESQLTDISKIKSELNEIINQLSEYVSSIENEKNSLESSMGSLKIKYEKTEKIAADLTQRCEEKEIENSKMKEIILSAQERYEELKREFTRSQQELEVVSTENKEFLETLRAREIELAELNEKFENNRYLFNNRGVYDLGGKK